MSFTLPKSESTTSLLRSSVPARSAAQPPDHPGARRTHHQRSAAASGAEPAECDASSRRPLCHPSLVGTRNSAEKSHPQHSHSHGHALSTAHSQEDLSELPGGRERRTARRHHHHHHHHHHNRHHHHHHHRSTRDDLPQEPRPKHSHAARMPTRTQSFSESRDETALFFESPLLARPGSSASREACPPSTASSSPVPASSSRSSRRSGRSSAASSEADFNLRPFLSSVFGQVRLEHTRRIRLFKGLLFKYSFCKQ
ncbi:hypothetical protein PO909_018115 [Leuciscus waleckii]